MEKHKKIAKILKIVKKKIVNKIKLYLIRSKQKPTQSLYSLERDKWFSYHTESDEVGTKIQPKNDV